MIAEFTCIGCKNCTAVCNKTFTIEEDYGRARVVNQGCATNDRKQEAIETCPVSSNVHLAPGWGLSDALALDWGRNNMICCRAQRMPENASGGMCDQRRQAHCKPLLHASMARLQLLNLSAADRFAHKSGLHVRCHHHFLRLIWG